MTRPQKTSPSLGERGENPDRSTSHYVPDRAAPQHAAILAETSAMTGTIEAGLDLIARSRKAAAACASASGREHFRRVADDEANRLADLLQIRHPAPVPPPAKSVPPRDGAIRKALAAYQAIARAAVDVMDAQESVRQAFARNDHSWERATSREADAERRLATLHWRYPHGA